MAGDEKRRRARLLAAVAAACTFAWATGGLVLPVAAAVAPRSPAIDGEQAGEAPAGDEGEAPEDPYAHCPPPSTTTVPGATTTSSTTTTSTTTTTTTTVPVDPNAPTTTTTTLPCPDPDVPPTTVPGDPAATTVPPDPGSPTTTTATTAPPADPSATTAPTTAPATTAAPTPSAPTTAPAVTTPVVTAPAAPAAAPPPPPPPPPPPTIPIPPPASAPPPVGEPVPPAIADPVQDPLADAATAAAARLDRWQAANTSVAATVAELAALDPALTAARDGLTAAQAALAALPPEPGIGAPPTTGVPGSEQAALAPGAPAAAVLGLEGPEAPPTTPAPPPDPAAAARAAAVQSVVDARAALAPLEQQAADLQARQVEQEIVARAAALGHDDARRALADLVAARLAPVSGGQLDSVWSTTDPLRLAVLYTALRQVGDPYVFATSGPERFDCSGLTLYAWQSVGVHLAHYSFTQRGQTPAVAQTDLQPGDLVFHLRAASGHVMLYLGVENAIVHAPSAGRRVEVSRWRTVNGFGSPLAPVAPEATDGGVTVAGDATLRAVGPVAAPGATTPAEPVPAPPPTWVGGVVAGARMVDAPDAPLYDSAGARYGVDPALLAGRTQAVADAAARVAAEALATSTSGPPTTGTVTTLATDPAAPEPGAGPLGLRADLAAQLGVDPLDLGAATDATARYLAAATARLGSLEAALDALDAGAAAVVAGDAAATLADATLALAAGLRPPPPAPPEPPVLIYAVAGLPPASPPRVTGLRRRAA